MNPMKHSDPEGFLILCHPECKQCLLLNEGG